MNAIIVKRLTLKDGKERRTISVCGICIYMSERPASNDDSRRPVGFIQFPSEAPTEVIDEDYYPEES